ncbi:ATP-binding protein [Streptomyces sp. BR123]|uniref:ATP-binding protein n=1 Tax=Streptomyces sp. BR123 TaxID=2749828 RepID=UPI0015C4971B|nr:ATP-binding protein [Streptomyces sp. BR123]NXY94320.1 ATP-binding protein [Streptomyces sp. BR123]
MDRTQGQAEPVERAAAGSGPHTASTPPARITTLTAGEYTLTVNPVDGSEIQPRRPGTAADRPARRDAAARREQDAAARPPAPPGSAAGTALLLAREEERERLAGLLGRGRSVRLTGPAGSGRTSLLDAVAADCAGLAPDGVVRLSGYGHQQPAELLHALHAAVYDASDERPERDELLARVRDIGAIVLLDDLELGGSALEELLRATPECAYLLAAGPDTEPSDDAQLEEVSLSGLSRSDCLQLLEAGVGRPLTDEETAWAEDLHFASEGLPLRFVQAAALLRRRDELNRGRAEDEDEEPGVFEARPRDTGAVPLPTLAEGAAPAELLASRASESARAALRIACALGGELPHHAHLPALVGDTHADTAVAELLGSGLITSVGPRYRLAAGVARQLEEAGYADTAAEEARTAARHYAWWTAHSSVTPARVAAEADAVLSALGGADVVAAVLLARSAAPAFAASRHWEAWERVLRAGAEAARKAGEVAEQAYFHHELGVLALCEGRLDRARAELEASIGLKGALADKRGTVAGRRALALVADREAAGVAGSPPLRLEAPADAPAPAAAPVPAAAPARPGAAPAPTRPAAPAARPAASAGSFASLSQPSAPAAARSASPAEGRSVPQGAARPEAAVPAPASEAATAALPASEAVTTALPATGAATTAVPVIRRNAAPAGLSEVFAEAFPLDPKPTEPTRPVPPPLIPPRPVPRPDRQRRKPVLLAAAGVLAAVVLGTVVGLAMIPSEPEEPGSGPVTQSTPAPAEPGTASTGGNDPAPQPGASEPAAARSGSARPGQSAAPSASGSAAPSRRSSSAVPAPQPPSSAKPTATSQAPSPTVTPSPSQSPAPTVTTTAGTGPATTASGTGPAATP